MREVRKYYKTLPEEIDTYMAKGETLLQVNWKPVIDDNPPQRTTGWIVTFTIKEAENNSKMTEDEIETENFLSGMGFK